ncbi:MAG: hypothetical protein OET90_05525 [Desulfuromonadales bacterium]|nr:hypothetical protein [Desulfuromonadales bacterium]
MSLQVCFECPKCNEAKPFNLQDMAPGRRPVCDSCDTPAHITLNSLERLSSDLRQYCCEG